MSEKPRQKESRTTLSLTDQLRMMAERDKEILDIQDEYGIDVILFQEETHGIVATIVGFRMHDKTDRPWQRIPLEKTSREEIYQDFKTRLHNLFHHPLDIKELGGSNPIDLSSVEDVLDEEKVFHIVEEKYKGESELSYTTYVTTYPQISNAPPAYTSDRERSTALDMWLERWRYIHTELAGKEIIAFWWKEEELHIIAEVDQENDDKDYSDGNLQGIVTAEGIFRMLKEQGLEKRITITGLTHDSELGEKLRQTDDENEWSSSYDHDSLELITDINGLMKDEDELLELASVLREELSSLEKNEEIMILLTEKDQEDEGEEWRNSINFYDERTLAWDIELYKKMPNGNV